MVLVLIYLLNDVSLGKQTALRKKKRLMYLHAVPPPNVSTLQTLVSVSLVKVEVRIFQIFHIFT